MRANPGDLLYSSLDAVSCPSTTSCFAVGSYPIGSLSEALIEHWNGKRWTIMANREPGDDVLFPTGLTGVSCPSTSSCFAVGNFEDNRIEHWNGHVWSFMTGTPSTRSAYAPLAGISCASTKNCVAVGRYGSRKRDSEHQVIEHWNGRGGWSIMTGLPVPSRDDELSGVSCPSTKSCFVVGKSSHTTRLGSVQQGFVEHWNGRGGWSLMTGYHPDSANSQASSVACSSTTSCFAVGGSELATPFGEFIYGWVEHWDGSGGWQVMTSPNGPNLEAHGIACPSPSNCVAVGAQPPNSNNRTLIERYA